MYVKPTSASPHARSRHLRRVPLLRRRKPPDRPFYLTAAARYGHDQVPPLADCYLGDDITDVDAAAALCGAAYTVERPGDIDDAVAALLADGQIVARCAGRMEFGARALGNRSILADPADADLPPPAQPVRETPRLLDVTLEDFDFNTSPKLPAAQIRDLAALRWLHAGESVTLYGPVGVGKTHIAKPSGTPPSARAPTSASPRPAGSSPTHRRPRRRHLGTATTRPRPDTGAPTGPRRSACRVRRCPRSGRRSCRTGR
jgi:hypothetical protein